MLVIRNAHFSLVFILSALPH